MEDTQSYSYAKDAISRLRKSPIAVVSFCIIVGYFVLAIGCYFDWFFPGATTSEAQNFDARYQAPSWGNWLGTDIFGRDVLAQAAHATITSLMLGLCVAGLSILLGTSLGALAGYFGGWVDALILWIYTTIDTIPYILLISAMSYSLKGIFAAWGVNAGFLTMVFAMGLTSWIGLCRLVRAEVMKHRDREYVQAAKAIGASHRSRIFRHILPNISHIILVNFALSFVASVKGEVILTFLGLGVDVDTPSWGVMIDSAKQELASGIWWGMAAATLFMFFLVLALNLFTDALREALDPKLKHK